MRFSLKWLLAGTVYVAIAAAAFASGKWIYADLLWLFPVFTAVFALLVVIFARGERRATASGFLIAIAALIFCAYYSPVGWPIDRVIVAAFPLDSSVKFNSREEYEAEARRRPARGHAANAIATMAAGLVGAVLGTVAYRRGRVVREGE